jgi:hypothetical protein
MTALENGVRIHSTSQKLFKDVLLNMPVIPDESHMVFVADGLKEPSIADKEAWDPYLLQCRAAGIEPMSRTKMHFTPTGW